MRGTAGHRARYHAWRHSQFERMERDMPATIIDGRAIADQVRRELAGRITTLAARGVTPGLAAVLVGDDPASAAYVRGK